MLKLAQTMYERIIDRRNRQFDAQKRPIVPVTSPVISIGNITVGGTGKSPAVQMVARVLIEQGLHPAIVMRGYRRRSRGLVVVHDGETIRTSVEAAGDEAYMHATMLGIPVIVSADKVEAAAHAAGMVTSTGAACSDVIIVDDGFQHRQLHRCTDIVLVNQETLTTTLLPVGRLREPLTNLGRASIVVCDDAALCTPVRQFCRADALVVTSRIDMHCAAPTSTPIVIVSGIANPVRMRVSLEGAGYTIAEQLAFGDHHRYRTKDLWKIRDAAAANGANVVTTDKDIAKIQQPDALGELGSAAVFVAHIRMVIDDARFEQRILQDITNEDSSNKERREEY
jgi:tetraacyldisaccharide 4'-kinase